MIRNLMKMQNRAYSLLLAIMLLSTSMLISQYPVSANVPPPLESMKGFSIVDGMDSGMAKNTFVQASIPGVFNQFTICNGILDPKCTDKNLVSTAYLLPCSGANSYGCIIEVYAISPAGEKVQGQYIRSFGRDPTRDSVQYEPKRLVAGSGAGGLWKFPALLHGGDSDFYAVQARLSGWDNNQREFPGRFKYDSAQFSIAGIKSSTGDYTEPNFDAFRLNIDGDRAVSGLYPDCILKEANICYERTSLPPNYRFGMKVRLPNALSGWFHGRVAKPDFVVTDSSSKIADTYEYQFEANPVKIPLVSSTIPYDSWSEDLKQFVLPKYKQGVLGSYFSLLLPGNSGKNAIEITKRLLPMIEDKSTGTGDYWLIRTLDNWIDGETLEETYGKKIIQCYSDPTVVSGVVTTNAMVYTQGPPTFNTETDSLDYKILSPHFNEKGAENIGSYDLLINSSVARCIYGFSSAPIKAEVEVVGSDGKTKVATTTLGERGPWLYLSANGFTFSEPTVRVKLSQAAVLPTPSPSPSTTSPTVSSTPSPTPSANSQVVTAQGKTKRTITCVKGTTKRKVTSVTPKCPKGFKRV